MIPLHIFNPFIPLSLYNCTLYLLLYLKQISDMLYSPPQKGALVILKCYEKRSGNP